MLLLYWKDPSFMLLTFNPFDMPKVITASKMSVKLTNNTTKGRPGTHRRWGVHFRHSLQVP